MRRRTLIVALAALALLLVAGCALSVALFEGGGRIEEPGTVTVGTTSTRD